jgi:hypothetical protein
MNRRGFVCACAAALAAGALVALAAAIAQTQPPSTASGWSAPRTPWGDPDIQGLWPTTEWKGVPLQRSLTFGTRNVLTEDEFAEREKQAASETAADAEEFKAAGAPIGENPPEYWQDRGKPKTQASLIVEPANGRLPPLTPEGQERVAARAAAKKMHGPADSWADRSLYERCIMRREMNFMPTLYNNGHQILQTKGYVVIRHEMINETRIVPIGERPFTNIRTYIGESRGHWEGDTLIVETKNFLTSGTLINITRDDAIPVSDSLRVIERFRRTGDHTLAYEKTVDDPKTWTQPWKVAFEITEDPTYPLYEYACHEGNYALVNILKGARAAERAAQKTPN